MPGAAREAVRRGRDLAEHVQRVVARARERRDRDAPRRGSSPRIAAAAAPAGVLLGRDGALPGHEVAALGQQRRGVLEDHRQRGRARGRSRGRARRSRRPLLGARVDDGDVRAARRPRPRARGSGSGGSRSRPAHTCASGQRGGEREARPAGAGAEVGDPRAARHDGSSSATSESATCRSTASTGVAHGRRGRRDRSPAARGCAPSALDRRAAGGDTSRQMFHVKRLDVSRAGRHDEVAVGLGALGVRLDVRRGP